MANAQLCKSFGGMDSDLSISRYSAPIYLEMFGLICVCYTCNGKDIYTTFNPSPSAASWLGARE